LFVFWLVPRPLRDLAYDFVARRRTRWFGRRSSCRVPTPEERGRFLEDGSGPV
jgi:predicted DCC family thiol-disulfide oxidoreductase YuxK